MWGWKDEENIAKNKNQYLQLGACFQDDPEKKEQRQWPKGPQLRTAYSCIGCAQCTLKDKANKKSMVRNT